MNTAPVFFLSHGAPSFALEPGTLGPQLRQIGQQLGGLAAALVVSPHWQTRGLRVMHSAHPGTIHDFGGFAPELYTLQYPAPGHPHFAVEARRLLSAAGFAADADEQRGFDHGAWVPLLHLLPDAKTPVFQVSLPHSFDTASALRLGQALAPLRQQGVAIIGSGSLTHNLDELQLPDSAAAGYAQKFADWVRHQISEGGTSELLSYRQLAPQAARAHPTEEHFLPLLVALGARHYGESVRILDGGITYGVLSMDSYVWGMHNP